MCVFTVWLKYCMANKFTRIQLTTARYLEAVNQTKPLTMLSATETKNLSLAGQELIGTDETLIYKYREEFLHIQQVAEKGLTNLDLLVETPSEFKIVAEAWGFTVTAKDKYNAGIVYTKNLNQTEFKTQISNVNIDWSKPNPPTIDVDYYRLSGNLVNLADSTIVIPKVEAVKSLLKVGEYTPAAVSTTSNYTVPNIYGEESVRSEATRYSGIGTRALFLIGVSVINGQGQTYTLNRSAAGGRYFVEGERLLIPGTSFYNGSSPENDALITILTTSTYSAVSGFIVSARIEGRAPNGWVNASSRVIATGAT